MRQSDIFEGRKYQAKVSGQLTTVVVKAIRKISKYSKRDYRGLPLYRESTVYDVVNLRTNRELIFHSATKFRKEIEQ